MICSSLNHRMRTSSLLACKARTCRAIWGRSPLKMATRKGVTSAQLAVAWLMTRGADILPLVGISWPRIADNLKAQEVTFTNDELMALERVFAPGAIVGDRYPPFAMRWAAK